MACCCIFAKAYAAVIVKKAGIGMNDFFLRFKQKLTANYKLQTSLGVFGFDSIDL